MRKRPVLLLELMISLVLFSVIVGILFSSYKELSLTKSLLRKDKELILTRQKLQLRLAQIFSHLKTLKMEGPSCILTYENEIDKESQFRGTLEGMLYIDKGRLAFVTWPQSAQEKEQIEGRKEILFESAASFSFDFFDAKKGIWGAKYPEQKPFMMKIVIDNTPYPFFL